MNANLSQLEAIFHEALAKSDAERPAYLESACEENADLRQRVEALLAAHAERGEFLGGTDGATVQYAEQGTASHLGTLIAGKYKLLEVIGEGGMGTVFVAEQTTPVRRKVAVKIIKPGMDSKSVLARFEAERQALALMDHPNIARVLDAGTTEQGLPYFVMELVKGTPITKFCDERKLSPRERLELFVPVCQAIQHAHQKGVIHRDIKPSNVLVALYDERPIPKVIDFGVAKATGQALTEHTLHTGFGAIIGTPEYMSPEQATFNQLDIDTRSDVYALGVLLYELLTGTTPVDKVRLGQAAVLEVLRVVREEEPARPSVKLTTAEARASIAATRGTEPEKLSKLLRGELDWIVMKALEKDRNRRYDTAAGLAKDVQRYLSDELVEARPPSAQYRLARYARKNRTPLLFVLTLICLIAGWVSSMQRRTNQLHEMFSREFKARLDADEQRKEADKQRWEAVEQRGLALAAKMEASESAQKATRAQRLAETNEQAAKVEADEAYRVLGLFRITLLGGGPDQTVGQRVEQMKPLLDMAETIPATKDHPRIEAGLRMTFGMAYAGWGDTAAAYENLERALTLYRANGGLNRPDVLAEIAGAALIFEGTGEFDRAAKLFEEILPIARAKYEPDSPDVFVIVRGLAGAYTSAGKYAKAVPLWKEVVRWRRDDGKGRFPDALSSALDELGQCLLKLDKPAEAEPILRERLTLLEKSGGRGSRAWITTTTNLADCLRRTKKFMTAEMLLLETLKAFGLPDGKEPISDENLKQLVEQSIRLLAEIYDETKQPDQAAKWRGTLSR